jgi:hypothetical protein
MTVTTTGTTLAGQLRAAETAAVAPQQEVGRLRTALDAAVAEGDFVTADKLQKQLRAAAEQAAIATAAVDALRGAAVRAEQQAADAGRMVEEARQRAGAERVITDANAAEQRAKASLRAAINEMYQHLAAAKRAYLAALPWEGKITAERYRVIQANHALGVYPAGHPGPTPSRANDASRLAETDPLVRALLAWKQ